MYCKHDLVCLAIIFVHVSFLFLRQWNIKVWALQDENLFAGGLFNRCTWMSKESSLILSPLTDSDWQIIYP